MTQEYSNTGQDQDPGGGELFSPEFRAYLLNSANEAMARLNREADLRELARRRTGEIVEMIEELFEPGDTFSFEQLLAPETPAPISIDSTYIWNQLDDDKRKSVLEEVGSILDLDIQETVRQARATSAQLRPDQPWAIRVPTNRVAVELLIEEDENQKVWYRFRRAEEIAEIDDLGPSLN